ncbi:MAG TPA: NADP-dependent phosphogluconate dehydrogenase [Candidatus Obscuribacterales bacterium]
MAGKAQVGLVGLGVMGENLVLNMERNGFTVAVYNRTAEKIDAFVNDAAKGKKIIGCKDPKTFCDTLETPRIIILLVKAGAPVDQTIEHLKPYLSKGDIIVDGGNSYFMDTQKREKELKAQGIYFIGSGVSGGEEGALWGPSLMPGGDKQAYEKLKPIWEAIAAKAEDGKPCVTYLGPDGAGHFVKMVHNGIEYGDMQLIAEVYDVMRKVLGMPAREIADVFSDWNKGQLDSFLIEITSQILRVQDPETKKPLVDVILDKAGQKGTGKWTAEQAQELAVPTPTIDAALTARLLSALKDERVRASEHLPGPNPTSVQVDKQKLLAALADALFASKICSYAQGMALIKAGSVEYKWGIDLAECAAIWRGGCIIRAKMLAQITEAFRKNADLSNLMLYPEFSQWMEKAQNNWRHVISTATQAGVPIPALSGSLAYFDSYRSANLPQNLTQAQRDLFGAHTYERADKPGTGFTHSDWQALIKAEDKAQAKS